MSANNSPSSANVSAQNELQKHESLKLRKEIQYYDVMSPSVQYLKTLQLSKGCFRDESEFKKLICHMLLTIIDKPYNVSLILNLNLPLSLHRSLMSEKFRKLDHILNIVVQTPEPSHNALLLRWKQCTYKDIVAHYTRYQLIVNSDEYEWEMNNANNNKENNNNNQNNKNKQKHEIECQYIRSNILGNNSNLLQFLQSIKDHLSCDHGQFLTTSAPTLTNDDLDLLICRFYCICEALVSYEFGAELIVDENAFYKDILKYLNNFIGYCFVMNNTKTIDDNFEGLKNEHLKLLIASIVILENGLKKSRPIIRSVIDIKYSTFQYLDSKLGEIDITKANEIFYPLKRKIVDTTSSCSNELFVKEINSFLKPMYSKIMSFLISDNNST